MTAVAFDLSQIALLGAISILLVHAVVHIGHLRVISVVDAIKISTTIPIVFVVFIATAFVSEVVPRCSQGRTLKASNRLVVIFGEVVLGDHDEGVCRCCPSKSAV